ncbi:MAG: tetraacyldisaccharide 4'-kinase [Rhodospirillales bacterium]|nr:tetraacyldisaccharide 4'-kinase [Rhodospirillales bacterium]
MPLTAPTFWYKKPGLAAWLLWPFSLLYRLGVFLKTSRKTPYKSPVPVICIGNLVTGGSGKTPGALAVMSLIQNALLAERPCFLSRGYGGQEKGPLLLNPDHHTAAAVGDEPLLLADKAPVIIGGDRAKSAALAEEKHFDLLVMDDGLQNPGLYQDIKLIAIDGRTGFGNRFLLPAGPLREPLAGGLKKADAFILIGEDRQNCRTLLPHNVPVFTASLEVPESWIADPSVPYVAFSGLAHPEKFYETLRDKGLNIIDWTPFPDHHAFSAEDLAPLADKARAKQARLITTAKDAVRLPAAFARENPVDILPVRLLWDDEDAISSFLKDKLK